MPPKKKLRIMTTKQACSSAGRDLKVNKTSAAGKRLQKCKTKPTKLSARINAPKKKGPKMLTVKKETIKRVRINAPKKKGPKMLKVKKERRKKKKKMKYKCPLYDYIDTQFQYDFHPRAQAQAQTVARWQAQAQAEAEVAALERELLDFPLKIVEW